MIFYLFYLYFAAGGTLNRLTSTRSLPGMVNQDGVSDEEIIPANTVLSYNNNTSDPPYRGVAGEEGKDTLDGHLNEDRLRLPLRTEQELPGKLSPDER